MTGEDCVAERMEHGMNACFLGIASGSAFQLVYWSPANGHGVSSQSQIRSVPSSTESRNKSSTDRISSLQGRLAGSVARCLLKKEQRKKDESNKLLPL